MKKSILIILTILSISNLFGNDLLICNNIPRNFEKLDLLNKDLQYILPEQYEEVQSDLANIEYNLALKAYEKKCYYIENNNYSDKLINRIEQLLISREQG